MNFSLPSVSLRVKAAYSALFLFALTPFASAASAMFDPSAPPTDNKNFSTIWANFTLAYLIFTILMWAFASFSVYMGSLAIRKHEWSKVGGWWGSGFAVFLVPVIIKFFASQA